MIRPVAEYWPEFAQKGKENITLATYAESSKWPV